MSDGPQSGLVAATPSISVPKALLTSLAAEISEIEELQVVMAAIRMATDLGGVDIHLDPPGAAPYAELRARALNVDVGVNVLVAGLDDLIAMKRASGRPIDRSDVLALTEP